MMAQLGSALVHAPVTNNALCLTLVFQLSFDTDNAITGAKGGVDFSGVEVSATVFGTNLNFSVDINPYVPAVAGPAIAMQAIATYQKSLAG